MAVSEAIRDRAGWVVNAYSNAVNADRFETHLEGSRIEELHAHAVQSRFA